MAAQTLEKPRSATHEVLNQSVPRVGFDEFELNLPLVEGVKRYDAGWARERLHQAGRLVGSGDFQLWAEQANTNPPRLDTHDRYGNRVDEVVYHPAYHQVMRVAVGLGALYAGHPRAVNGFRIAKETFEQQDVTVEASS